jgi:hypothetical protein
VGFSAVAVVVLGWLLVSFMAPGPRRTVVEWLSATFLYIALVSLFSNLVHRAWEQGSTVALIAFGFLLALFSAGFLVCLVNAVLSLGGPRETQQSATH